MNQLQKAKEYADRYNGNYQISQDDIEEAYIAGSKDMYIKKEHEKIYNPDEYLPPAANNYRTVEVFNYDTGGMVYYDYDQKSWLDDTGDSTSVERWTFGEPEKVEPEKSAHQLAEEVKQAQFEIEEMKNVIKQLNKFRFSANEQVEKLVETFEELLRDQFTLCELRDVWRKRAGLVQKCEE